VTKIFQPRRLVLLHVVIVLAIAMAAGPEVILAMEMTTLLEMLGASLFVTAYFAGARLAAITVARSAREFILPATHLAVIRADASWREKAPTLVSVAVNAAGLLLSVVVGGAWVRHVIPFVA
jgi:hypothetical protein